MSNFLKLAKKTQQKSIPQHFTCEVSSETMIVENLGTKLEDNGDNKKNHKPHRYHSPFYQFYLPTLTTMKNIYLVLWHFQKLFNNEKFKL